MSRKLTRALSLASLISVLVCPQLMAQDAAAGPKLVIEEKILDLGTVAQGEVVAADFKLANEGSETLVLKAVRPTCGCTVADYSREIPPGEVGWIKSKLDTTDFSGPISKSILVMTNDGQDPTVTVVIKANVQPYVEVLPRPLIRFNAIKHEDMTQTVIVTAAEKGRDFDITGVDSSVPFLKTSVRRLEGEERIKHPSATDTQYEITVTLADDAPVGPVSAQLAVHTSHPKAPEVPIKVYGVIRAALHVTPPQIQFGTVEVAAEPSRTVIVVNNRTDGETEVTSAGIGDPAFGTELRTIDEGRRYQVTVTVKPDAQPGVKDTVLKLETTDPNIPELVVPVRADLR
jgi:hypothetical protein